MPWKVEQNTELGTIDSTYTGTVTKQDVEAATNKAFTLAKGEGPHRFLAKLCSVKLEMNFAEIFGIPDQWEALGFRRMNKLAILLDENKELIEAVNFYVANCRSRGWRVAKFSEHQAAINWLMN